MADGEKRSVSDQRTMDPVTRETLYTRKPIKVKKKRTEG